MAPQTDERHPWLLGVVIVGVWVLAWVGLRSVLFGGDPLAAAVQGVAGGAAFAVVFIYLRRQGSD